MRHPAESYASALLSLLDAAPSISPQLLLCGVQCLGCVRYSASRCCCSGIVDIGLMRRLDERVARSLQFSTSAPKKNYGNLATFKS